MSQSFGKKWANLDQPPPNVTPTNIGLQYAIPAVSTSAKAQENVTLGKTSTQVNNLTETVAFTHT